MATEAQWVADKDIAQCENPDCKKKVWLTRRKHHFRACGHIFCTPCSSARFAMMYDQGEARFCMTCSAVRPGHGRRRAWQPGGRRRGRHAARGGWMAGGGGTFHESRAIAKLGVAARQAAQVQAARGQGGEEVRQLSDYEGAILDLPPRIKPNLAWKSLLEGLHPPSVMAFGLSLHEMATDIELDDPAALDVPLVSQTGGTVATLLNRIYFDRASAKMQKKPLSIRQLCEHPLFCSAELGGADMAQLLMGALTESTLTAELKRSLGEATGRKSKDKKKAKAEKTEQAAASPAAETDGEAAPEPEPAAAAAAAPDRAEYIPFVKMTKMGVPLLAAEMKAQQAGLDPQILRSIVEAGDEAEAAAPAAVAPPAAEAGRAGLLDAIRAGDD